MVVRPLNQLIEGKAGFFCTVVGVFVDMSDFETCLGESAGDCAQI
jgi:hypothetical protein